MKEFIEKLIERLEEYKYTHLTEHDSEECLHCKVIGNDWCEYRNCPICAFEKSEKIVKELAEEYSAITPKNLEKVVEEICDCDSCSGCCNCHEEQRMMECEDYVRVLEILRRGVIDE